MSSYRKDLEKLARRYGFRVVGMKGSGHIMLANDRGGTVTASYSPKNAHVALRCTERLLRKGGQP